MHEGFEMVSSDMERGRGRKLKRRRCTWQGRSSVIYKSKSKAAGYKVVDSHEYPSSAFVRRIRRGTGCQSHEL